jgi:hypothetical protein
MRVRMRLRGKDLLNDIFGNVRLVIDRGDE